MERRRETRIQTDEYVRVTTLTNPPGNPIIGRALDLSGRGLSLLLAHSVTPGVPVRIDLPEQLLLGEVIYCKPQNGTFRTGIEVDQVLRRTRDLEVLRRAIHGSAETEDAPVHGEVHVPLK